MDEKSLIHDWNKVPDDAFDWENVGRIQLDDETLRDGLQNPSVVDPSIEQKLQLLHLMDELGRRSRMRASRFRPTVQHVP